jgi:carboxyl-terminal processing protease
MTAFKTVHSGRTVYDGGGILPDVEVEKPTPAVVTQSLSGRLILFDYAIKYHFEHPTIKPAKEFSLSDAEYQDFVKWYFYTNF